MPAELLVTGCYRSGTTLLETGRVLRPQDIGVMSSIGIVQLAVVRRLCVRLVITGNELLPGDHLAGALGELIEDL